MAGHWWFYYTPWSPALPISPAPYRLHPVHGYILQTPNHVLYQFLPVHQVTHLQYNTIQITFVAACIQDKSCIVARKRVACGPFH